MIRLGIMLMLLAWHLDARRTRRNRPQDRRG